MTKKMPSYNKLAFTQLEGHKLRKCSDMIQRLSDGDAIYRAETCHLVPHGLNLSVTILKIFLVLSRHTIGLKYNGRKIDEQPEKRRDCCLLSLNLLPHFGALNNLIAFV